MNAKAKAQRAHAFRRARERFDLHLTQNDHAQIVRAIQGGKAKFVERQSHRVTLWDINYSGEDLRVVYDSQRKELVTFLFPVEA